jgi:hypothetical protein
MTTGRWLKVETSSPPKPFYQSTKAHLQPSYLIITKNVGTFSKNVKTFLEKNKLTNIFYKKLHQHLAKEVHQHFFGAK